MNNDVRHNLPIPGRCYMTLNPTTDQFQIIQEAILQTPACNHPDAVEASLAEICAEWMQFRRHFLGEWDA